MISIDAEIISRSYKIYMTGFTITCMAMMIKGINAVTSEGKSLINMKALAGISGIGHIILSIGIVMLFTKIFMKVRKENISE